MILQVFKSIGCILSIADAYTALLSLYSNQIYPMKFKQNYIEAYKIPICIRPFTIHFPEEIVMRTKIPYLLLLNKK